MKELWIDWLGFNTSIIILNNILIDIYKKNIFIDKK